jgi:dephospho-CoA kinase
MLRLGLTGGIASGKSTVAAMLREMGFSVLDADSLAHTFLEPGQAACNEVLREFGVEILGLGGGIDRAKLATLVFADPQKLARLNAIIHPRVEEAVQQQFDEWSRDAPRDAAFVEAALLIEAGYLPKLDGLVVAWCRPEQQLDRLLTRGLTEQEARQRIAAQLPIAEKLRLATEKIDCSGSLDDTRRQVLALTSKLRSHSTTRLSS